MSRRIYIYSTQNSLTPEENATNRAWILDRAIACRPLAVWELMKYVEVIELYMGTGLPGDAMEEQDARDKGVKAYLFEKFPRQYPQYSPNYKKAEP